jgi:hypothetical protein
MDSWVPKKLEIDLKFDSDKQFDFKAFIGTGLKEGEKAMPEAA